MKIIALFLFVLSLAQLAFSQTSVFPYKYSDKYGIVDEFNNKVTEPVFDHISLFCNQAYNKYTVFSRTDNERNSLYGILDNKGNIKVPPKYKDLKYDGNGFFCFIQEGDSLLVMQIENQKTIFLAKPSIESYNSMVIASDFTTGKRKVIFRNGTSKEIPNGYLEDYIVVFEDQSCPVLLTKNEIMDCTGKIITQSEYRNMDQNEIGIDEIYESYSDIKEAGDMPSVKETSFSTGRLTPVYDAHGEIAAVIQTRDNTCTLMNPGKEILFYSGQCSFMESFVPFKDEGMYIEYGISGHKGLLDIYGHEILKAEFIDFHAINSWDDSQFNKNIEQVPELLNVYHNSGYSGFANTYGKVFLPKECNCIK
ncbi:MAG TPA: WG repeat-containing protein [Saprospiraceae bacterium]|nr:WG repeat-containing protein [Saprospiraceae bacterium]